jgi:putative restriction endonuclease
LCGIEIFDEILAKAAMKLYVGVTNDNWFRFLAERNPEEVNGAFRVEVIDAYSRRCAITGEKTLPALEAGHIRPYAKEGPHEIRNGLLLRSDLHNLFDQGYLTVTVDYRVEVSRRIREEFENGRHYYELQGQRLAVVPERESDRPAPEFLGWHNGIFKG